MSGRIARFAGSKKAVSAAAAAAEAAAAAQDDAADENAADESAEPKEDGAETQAGLASDVTFDPNTIPVYIAT